MEEEQYLKLVKNILEKGSQETGRNGTTLSIFGEHMRFSLKKGTLPVLTTKKMAWKTCFKELMFFIRGQTNNTILKEQDVHIWDANGSREFLDSRGLAHTTEDDLGPIYGFQWRHYNAEYKGCNHEYTGEGVDQLKQIIDALKDPHQRNSRRLIMTAWNPPQLDEMALPPCHILCQFNVRDGKYLSCALYQRSGDVGLGVPFNILSYSFLTHILAAHCGLEADEFVYFLGNAHIYTQHISPLKQQLQLERYEFPKIAIKKCESIEDYDIHKIEWITPYKNGGPIKMGMIA